MTLEKKIKDACIKPIDIKIPTDFIYYKPTTFNITKKYRQFQIDLKCDDFYATNTHFIILTNNKLNIYNHQTCLNFKLIKVIKNHLIIFYRNRLNQRVSNFLYKLVLNLINLNIKRVEAYLTGILVYLDIDHCVNVREYLDGFRIKYRGGKSVFYNEFLQIQDESRFNNESRLNNSNSFESRLNNSNSFESKLNNDSRFNNRSGFNNINNDNSNNSINNDDSSECRFNNFYYCDDEECKCDGSSMSDSIGYNVISENNRNNSLNVEIEEMKNEELQNNDLKCKESLNEELQNNDLKCKESLNEELPKNGSQNEKLQYKESLIKDSENEKTSNNEIQNNDLKYEKSQYKDPQNEKSQYKEIKNNDLQYKDLQNEKLHCEKSLNEKPQYKDSENEKTSNNEIQNNDLQYKDSQNEKPQYNNSQYKESSHNKESPNNNSQHKNSHNKDTQHKNNIKSILKNITTNCNFELSKKNKLSPNSIIKTPDITIYIKKNEIYVYKDSYLKIVQCEGIKKVVGYDKYLFVQGKNYFKVFYFVE